MRFLGRVSDEELVRLLSTADVCVNPDEVNVLNDISTMNKIVEYMALGRPIVQFDLMEGRTSAGPSSLYAAPNDATSLAEEICRLLDDEELRQTMGELGRERYRDELAWSAAGPPAAGGLRAGAVEAPSRREPPAPPLVAPAAPPGRPRRPCPATGG